MEHAVNNEYAVHNEQAMNNEYTEIDLKELMLALLRKTWIIILVAAIGAGGFYAVSKSNDIPTYVSRTKIYILSKSAEGTVTYNDFNLSTSLTYDYQELITARPVMEAVIEEMGLSYGTDYLASQISVTFPEDTRVITISVSDTSPERAMNIANSVRENASQHIKEVMDIQAVNMVEDASYPTNRQPSDVKKNTMIGALLGAALVIGIVTLRFLLDDTIKTPDEIEEQLGLSNLGTIPAGEVAFVTKEASTGESK